MSGGGGTYVPIDYVGLAAALLDRAYTLVPQWIPWGTQQGCYWYCGDFDGGEGKSANVNMQTGTWIDNGGSSDDKGGDLIALYARLNNLSNHAAALELMRDLGWGAPQQPVRRGDAKPAQRDDGGGEQPAAEQAAPAADVRAAKAKRRSMWRAIAPVPSGVPEPEFRFPFHDDKLDTWIDLVPVRTWRYEFDGEFFGYTARIERINSKGELQKDVMPLTWCEDESDGRGTRKWRWKQWDAPRPLYVPAGFLSADKSLPVVVVEGEKCAQAGMELLGHEFDFVTWPGGCKAWAQARWAWLMTRTVYLWPDCDSQREGLTKAEREAGTDPQTKPFKPAHKQPGLKAMTDIGTLLVADHGCDVFMVPIPGPGQLPDGWDIADAIEQGWDAARVRDFIRKAVKFVPASDEARAKAGPQTPSGAAAEEELESNAWRGRLLKTDKGAIKACRENAVLALDGMRLPDGRWLPGAPEAQGVIAFNEFTNNVELTRDPPWQGKAGLWGEETELEMGDWLSRELWLPPMSRQTLEEAVLMVGRRRAYHPVRQRFEALRGKWDGKKRLPMWIEQVCRDGEPLPAKDPLKRYLARVGTWFVMALVKRILEPGCKFDYMLVLEGQQGRCKSTLARILACGRFADTGLVLGDKDSYQNLQGVLVYEWAELDALAKADVRRVKSFVSSTTDRFRASFDRRPRDYPRQVVFIGTTNESHYLSDPTGNRRFWPVKVTRQIDLDWVRDNLDQMLAEAITRLDAGERMWPTYEEQEKLFSPQQGERTVESPLEAAIREFLYDEDQRVVGTHGVNGSMLNRVTLKGLLTYVGLPLEKQTGVITKEASAILARLGWERTTKMSSKEDIKRPWVYERPRPGTELQAGASQASADQATDENSPPQGTPATEDADACPF